MIKFPLTVLGGIYISLSAATVATSQTFECGEVAERPCGLLNLALDRWSEVQEQYDLELSPESVEYLGSSESEIFAAAADALLKLDGQTFLALNPVETTATLLGADSLDPGLMERHFEDLVPMLDRMQHVVRINWSYSDGDFSTNSFLSTDWPYIFDPVLSSVVLEDESNSCMHKTLRWLWGSTRGEILIDLVAVPTTKGLICQRVIEAWMNFGTAEAVATEPAVLGGRCTASFQYGWTTPLATLSVDHAAASVSVEGLGSNSVGTRDCVARPR